MALESSGWAPKNWTPQYFRDTLGVEEVPASGINSVTVPGAVAGWDAILKRFGTMGFKQVLEPARRYAADGFPVHERVAARLEGRWRPSSDGSRYGGRPSFPTASRPRCTASSAIPDLARALRLLQPGGRDAFYEGPIARAIVRKSRAAGGVMQLDDLAEFAESKGGKLVEPISVDYHGYDIHQLPPPGQGFAALEILNILDVCAPKIGVQPRRTRPEGPEYWHFIVEAKKLAYSDLLRYNADPAFRERPTRHAALKGIRSDACATRSTRRRPGRRTCAATIPGGTVYLTVGDRWGNMVSFVNSISGFFGSYVTVPGYGFLLNNRGANFTLEEGHPNQVAPRKRPFITIIAGFITKDGEPLMAFGNKGGTTQPQAQAQHVINLIDLGMNVQATADAVRFDHDQATDMLGLDTEQLELVGPQLTALGHKVVHARGQSGVYQGLLFERDQNLRPARMPPRRNAVLQGCARDNHGKSRLFERPLNGVYRAGSDLRQDGHAGGW